MDGTQEVAQIDIRSNIVAVGETLYFAADEPGTGKELWRSDGTQAGTSRVADIVPGPDDSSPRYLTVVGSTVYFDAWTPQHGSELRRSDGTEAGTELVTDILPGDQGSMPFQLTRHQDRLFFTANDGVHGSGGLEFGRHGRTGPP